MMRPSKPWSRPCSARSSIDDSSETLEAVTKWLALLHDLVPKAARIAVLVNPANASATEATLREIREATRALGLQIAVLNASTSREIEGLQHPRGRQGRRSLRRP